MVGFCVNGETGGGDERVGSQGSVEGLVDRNGDFSDLEMSI